MHSRFLTAFLVTAWLATGGARAEIGQPHAVHALVGARVWVTPDKVIDNATLIVRDGIVEAVGTGLTPPPEARIWHLEGKVIHAGFLDPYVTEGRLRGQSSTDSSPDAAGQLKGDERATSNAALGTAISAGNNRIGADRKIESDLRPSVDVFNTYRENGFVAIQAVPQGGIWRGQGAVYSLVSEEARKSLMRAATCSVLGSATVGWGELSEASYPGSLMGNIALVRQVLADVDWFARIQPLDQAAYLGLHRPASEGSLAALQNAAHGQQPLILETRSLGEGMCFSRILKTYPGLRLGWVLSLDQWRDLSTVGGLEPILPVNFSEAPRAVTAGEKLNVSLATLRNWIYGPRLPGWVAEKTGHFCLTTHRLKRVADFAPRVRLAMACGLSPARALDACTREPARWLGLGDRLGTLEPRHAASLVVRTGDPFTKGKIEEVWVEGVRNVFNPPPTEPKLPDSLKRAVITSTEPPLAPPETLHPAHPGSVLIRNLTVWTQEAAGVETGVDLLAVNGKLVGLGKGLSAPAGVTQMDGTGLHCTPGLIDHHSHSAIWGSVNEATRSTSSEVRTRDVLNPFDRAIHDQLAGGVTAAHVLHGSANAIGGQTVTVKWKWGCPANDLIFSGAPGGIKFALGENPKQSNWGNANSQRYPKSRMGVAELIRHRFLEARQYAADQASFAAGTRRLPVRPDLSLDPLVEILAGQRYVHCHSYRQDEILMLMRLAEELGFRVRTFQHVLEGYKIAAEIARHGAGASTFSDWWAYKLEVRDAIPYNAAILSEHGVLTSFNSDSDELARRLGTELPKAVRYGGLSEQQALNLLTVNPAKTLGVFDRIGSLKVGKDADFVLWSGPPLDPATHCQRTYIEGYCYFDAEREPARAAQLEDERLSLLNRVLVQKKKR